MNYIETNSIIAKKLFGWEVSHKAKLLKKRKMTFNEIPYGYFKINPKDLEEKIPCLLMRALDIIINLEPDSDGLSKFVVQSMNIKNCYYEVRFRDFIEIKIAEGRGDNFIDALHNMILDFIKWRENAKRHNA